MPVKKTTATKTTTGKDTETKTEAKEEKKLTPAQEKTAELKAAREAQKEAHKKDFKKWLGGADSNIKKFLKIKDKDKIVGFLPDMHADIKRFSSGSFVLDTITGGGFAHGRIIELYGPESSGKTTVALNSISDVQHEGGTCFFIDAENAFDGAYARTLGVNTDDLGFTQTAVAEDVFKLCIWAAKSKSVDLIVVDSVAALSPRAETDGGMEKQQMGALARTMSKGLRLLVPICSANDCSIIFLNQTREKVGQLFGNPETTPGGRALKFYATQRIEVRRKEVIKEGKKEIGTRVRLKIVKNKVGSPFGEDYTVLTFAHGLDIQAELLVVGKNNDLLYQKNAQSGFYYNPLHPKEIDEKAIGLEKEAIEGIPMYKLGKGKDKIIEMFKENKYLSTVLSKDIKETLDAKREGISLERHLPKSEDEEESEEDTDFEEAGI